MRNIEQREAIAAAQKAKLPRLVATAERLATDLRRILDGKGPSADELERAPTIENWHIGMRPVYVLFGHAFGHPLLGDREVMTSPIWVFEPEAGWVRTQSRFYRLERPAADRQDY